MTAEVLYAGRDPFTRKVVRRQGPARTVSRPGRPVIDDQRRRRPGYARVSVARGGDADHRQGPGGAGASWCATACARSPSARGDDGALELRFMPLNADIQNGDRLVTSGIDGTYPPGLPVADVSQRRAQRRVRLRAHRLHAARGRRPPPLRARAAAADAARPARPRRSRRGKREQAPQGRAKAHDAPLTRAARPHEILLPVQRWASSSRSFASRCSLNLLPWSAMALRVKPDFVALVLLYWVHPASRAGRLGRGLAARADHGRRRRRPVRPACARLRRARVRRASASPARADVRHARSRRCTWSRCCCWRSAVVLVVRLLARAPISRAGAYFVGSFVGALLWPLARRWLLRTAAAPRRRRARVARRELAHRARRRAARPRSASCTSFQLRLGVARRRASLFASACWSRASSICRSSSTSTTTRSPRRTASRSCRSCPTAASSLDRNGVVLAHNYSAYTLEITPARCTISSAPIDELADAGRDRAARPPALQEAAGGEQELRQPADPHAPDRRGDRALRRQPLSASPASRSTRGCSASIRRARSSRTSSATSAASTTRLEQLETEGDAANYTRHRLHRQDRPRGQLRTASCTAPPASRRSRSMPAAARCARCRARRRSRATISC